MGDGTAGILSDMEGWRRNTSELSGGKVFAGNAGTSEEPDAKDIEGFEKFIENYKGAIAVEKTASEVIK